MTEFRQAKVSAPSEPLLSPTDYRTKSPSSEKEMFHILPKLHAKRADFLTVMLTGSLHQRRAFTATPPETQNDGPRDDDVTKSESSSGASERSTERCQDGAPSTLVADDPHKQPKESGSVADVDPDQEDVSKTLVLFSPGDMMRSPNAMNGTEVDQGMTGSNAPQNEQSNNGGQVEVQIQEDINQVQRASDDLDPSIEMPKLVVTMSTTLVASSSIASPPFSKVERTFVHISETSHLNIMSSRGAQVREGDPEVLAIAEDIQMKVYSVLSTEPGVVHSEVTSRTPTEVSQILSVPKETSDKQEGLTVLVSLKSREPLQQDSSTDGKQPPMEEHHKEKPVPENEACVIGLSKSSRTRSKSRIPILVSEEDVRSEQSHSNKERLRRRASHQDLARLAVERQRQERWMRLNSRTSSSLSSGEEPKRASETYSTMGSEEDVHQSDDSLNKLKKEAEEKNNTGWSSRIPRPVTPTRKPLKLMVVAPVILQEAGTSKLVQKSSNGTKVESQTGSSAPPLHTRSKTTLSRSTVPSGSNRMPLYCIPVTSRRSLSTANGTFPSTRIASPSPQRFPLRTAVSESRKQPFTLRATVELPLKSRTTCNGTKQSTNTAVRNRTKVSAPLKNAVPVRREKSTSNSAAAAR